MMKQVEFDDRDFLKFFETFGEIPKVGEIKEYCNAKFNPSESGKYGEIVKLSKSQKVIKRLEIERGRRNISINDVKRETLLAIISYLYNPDLFVVTYGFFTITNEGKTTAYIIMDHGGDMLTKKQTVTLDEFHKLFEFVKNLEQILKELKIGHHDIKLDNILYETKNGIMFKLIDFGLARFQDDEKRYVGTLYCMPPNLIIRATQQLQSFSWLARYEQAILHSYKIHDSYSLGIVVLNFFKYTEDYKKAAELFESKLEQVRYAMTWGNYENRFTYFFMVKLCSNTPNALITILDGILKILRKDHKEYEEEIAAFIERTVLTPWKDYNLTGF
jgi:serine/threonine protein kinase